MLHHDRLLGAGDEWAGPFTLWFGTASITKQPRDAEIPANLREIYLNFIAGWFPDGHAGGPTGAELPAAMLESIRENDCLVPGGRLYLPTGTLQKERTILDAAKSLFGVANLQRLVEREFPLPDVVARSKAVAQMMKDGILDLRTRGSRLLWSLRIWQVVNADPGGRTDQLA